MLAGFLAFSIFTVAVPRWDRALMTSGPFINAARFVDVPPGRQLRDWLRRRSTIVYYKEGVEGTVSVRDVGEERLLVINGKTDGSRHGDRRTQLALTHLPLLVHPRPERVLLVGLGTGMSAAAAAAHSDVSSLSIIELSREVVEASRFFRQENEDVLYDPRVRLLRADARNFLQTGDEPFDVILSEPSNPWISGVSNLFTSEYFELARSRLSPDGIMAQWFQTYGMSQDDLRSVLKSFSDTFPEVTVWSPQLGDLLFLGSSVPQQVSLDRFRHLLTEARPASHLRSIDLADEAALARLFLLDTHGVRSFAIDAIANTDDRPRVEFNAPRNLYSETTLDNLRAIIEHLDGRSPVVPFAGLASFGDDAATMDSLGLSVRVPSGFQARAEWRVSWTAFVGDGTAPAPIGVGNRPTVVLESSNTSIEIERGWEQNDLSKSSLLDALASRFDGPQSAIGSTSLESGETAVWISTLEVPASRAAMAWSCGRSEGRASRYLALASSDSEEAEDLLGLLTRSIRCSLRG